MSDATFVEATEASTATPTASRTGDGTDVPTTTVRLRPGGSDDGFDPWLELIADHLRHNVTEVARLAGGRPILAVVKNNAYGMGDTIVGPVLAHCPEVVGIACVRPSEAFAMRAAGVRKTILTMAELGEDESAELVRHGVELSCWFDEAPDRLRRISVKAGRQVPVHVVIDSGMNREGMPVRRALPWMVDVARRQDVRIQGTYQQFSHDDAFDRVQLERFLAFIDAAQRAGIKPGVLHAAATYELYRLPESHLDMVRIGGALFGKPPGEDVTQPVDLMPVFRLRARVVRLEELEVGESAGFRRGFRPRERTRVALLPVGHTDGYPASAEGRCEVLIGDRLYPVVSGGVASAHTLIDVGLDSPVRLGDTATLIGPDDAGILPEEVGARTGVGFYHLITKLSALLPRRVV